MHGTVSALAMRSHAEVLTAARRAIPTQVLEQLHGVIGGELAELALRRCFRLQRSGRAGGGSGMPHVGHGV